MKIMFAQTKVPRKNLPMYFRIVRHRRDTHTDEKARKFEDTMKFNKV